MNMYEMWKQTLMVRVVRYELVYKLENCVSARMDAKILLMIYVQINFINVSFCFWSVIFYGK